MLPGLRILFAITFVSVSVLIFGLGAAAYLRSAHEDIATAPWRPIEVPATARVDLAPATLAMLRVEPESATDTPVKSEAAADVAAPGAAALKTEPLVAPTIAAPEQVDPPSPQVAEAPKPAAPDAPVTEAPVRQETQPAAEATAEIPLPATDASDAPAKVAQSIDASPPQVVVAALIPDPANVDKPALEPTPAPPAAETSGVAATAAPAPGGDTLKAEDKAIEAAAPPAQVAAVAEPALVAAKPLALREVRLPSPRVDPAVIEARKRQVLAQQQQQQLEQQRARVRAAQAKRAAAARARATAQAKAAAANPFAFPAPTQN